MKKKHRELIESLTDRELILNLIITQIILIGLSAGIGYFLFDGMKSFTKLFIWNDVKIFTVGALAGIGVVLIDVLFIKIVPKKWFDDGGLNKKLFQHRSIGSIFLISLSVAITEEILFRGVLQTHFGLIVSSLIFAFVHVRYLTNLFLFINVVALSFFIGYVYLLTGNLLVTMMMHFTIDFLLGLILRFSKLEIYE